MPVSELEGMGEWLDATANLAFGAARTPDPEQATLVIAQVSIESTGATRATVDFQVDGNQVASASVLATSGSLTGSNDVSQRESVTLIVPAGSSYTVVNTADPAGTNSIDSVTEAPMPMK